MEEQRGLIHRIERFSLHDGPGIRTLVVTKGCPLHCLWCSSPYTQKPVPEILHIRNRCRGCGSCIASCRLKAISGSCGDPPVIKTDRSICIGCGECVSACPNGARELSGILYTPEELFCEVEKDAAFYRRSGGGVTVGGGEPTAQVGFVGKFLSLCVSHFVHTALETSALTPWESLASLLSHLDLIYIDLKHMDEVKHREWTGVSNRRILENIRRAAREKSMILRIPVIPGFNDSAENISESAKFAKELGANLLRIELLPYHQFGIHKYAELDRDYAIESIRPPSDEQMARLRDIAREAAIAVEIGG